MTAFARRHAKSGLLKTLPPRAAWRQFGPFDRVRGRPASVAFEAAPSPSRSALLANPRKQITKLLQLLR